jgi:hypothetical protein
MLNLIADVLLLATGQQLPRRRDTRAHTQR